jgi:hypothetical protein
VKETVSKVKKQPTEGQKIIGGCASNKALVTRIYRELKKLNSQRINNPLIKQANEMNRHFSKEEVQMANIHMNKFSTSFDINEMQVKTTLRFHLTPFRMAIINNTSNNKC